MERSIVSVIITVITCIIFTSCTVDDVMDPFGKYEQTVISLTMPETTIPSEEETDIIEEQTEEETVPETKQKEPQGYTAVSFEGMTAGEIMTLYGRNRCDVFKFSDMMQMSISGSCPYYFDFRCSEEQLDTEETVVNIEVFGDNGAVTDGIYIGMSLGAIESYGGVKLETRYDEYEMYEKVSEIIEKGRYRILLEFDENDILRYAIINFSKNAGITEYTSFVETETVLS